MTRPRIRPSEVRQAQRWAYGGKSEAHVRSCIGGEEFMDLGFVELAAREFDSSVSALESPESDRQTLERLDHNLDDLRSADEESEEQ